MLEHVILQPTHFTITKSAILHRSEPSATSTPGMYDGIRSALASMSSEFSSARISGASAIASTYTATQQRLLDDPTSFHSARFMVFLCLLALISILSIMGLYIIQTCRFRILQSGSAANLEHDIVATDVSIPEISDLRGAEQSPLPYKIAKSFAMLHRGKVFHQTANVVGGPHPNLPRQRHASFISSSSSYSPSASSSSFSSEWSSDEQTNLSHKTSPSGISEQTRCVFPGEPFGSKASFHGDWDKENEASNANDHLQHHGREAIHARILRSNYRLPFRSVRPSASSPPAESSDPTQAAVEKWIDRCSELSERSDGESQQEADPEQSGARLKILHLRRGPEAKAELDGWPFGRAILRSRRKAPERFSESIYSVWGRN